MRVVTTSTRTVLLVEDDNDIRDALVQILEEEGYVVVAAAHGRIGLELMRLHRPMLILLDLMMPVMNGWQFREAQLQDAVFAATPVIVISADNSARQESEAMRVQGFLQKPIELSELLRVVAAFCPVDPPQVM
jgi:CheY-like chemotaxis protein